MVAREAVLYVIVRPEKTQVNAAEEMKNVEVIILNHSFKKRKHPVVFQICFMLFAEQYETVGRW